MPRIQINAFAQRFARCIELRAQQLGLLRLRRSDAFMVEALDADEGGDDE